MSKTVKVYSTPSCPHCIRLKEYLKENNIEFEEIDVAADQDKIQELVNMSGQMGVPVVDIEGEVIIGFDKERIAGVLGL